MPSLTRLSHTLVSSREYVFGSLLPCQATTLREARHQLGARAGEQLLPVRRSLRAEVEVCAALLGLDHAPQQAGEAMVAACLRRERQQPERIDRELAVFHAQGELEAGHGVLLRLVEASQLDAELCDVVECVCLEVEESDLARKLNVAPCELEGALGVSVVLLDCCQEADRLVLEVCRAEGACAFEGALEQRTGERPVVEADGGGGEAVVHVDHAPLVAQPLVLGPARLVQLAAPGLVAGDLGRSAVDAE